MEVSIIKFLQFYSNLLAKVNLTNIIPLKLFSGFVEKNLSLKTEISVIRIYVKVQLYRSKPLHKDFGKMAEWFKAPNWKFGYLHRYAGSNPVFSVWFCFKYKVPTTSENLRLKLRFSPQRNLRVFTAQCFT